MDESDIFKITRVIKKAYECRKEIIAKLIYNNLNHFKPKFFHPNTLSEVYIYLFLIQ